MTLNNEDMFFPVLSQRLRNLAKDYQMDRLEICASWYGADGLHSETQDVILQNDADPITLKQFEDSIIMSKGYNSHIRKSLLSHLDRFITDSSINILIDVRLPESDSGSETDPGQIWF